MTQPTKPESFTLPPRKITYTGRKGWLLNRCTPDNWIDNPPGRKL